MKRLAFICAAWSALALFASVSHAEPLELVDGDRVVLLGGTMIEREQTYGYWETAITAQYPDRNIIFRNLGWSGDNVWGEARAGFGSVADGFKALQDLVVAERPTVILVGYGGNESFAGQDGLPGFLAGLDTLLNTISQTKARIVILSPTPHEDLGAPLPTPVEQNKNLQLYRDALKKVAADRDYLFVDLYALIESAADHPPLTDNGIHFTDYGYWYTAPLLMKGLGLDVVTDLPAVTAGNAGGQARVVVEQQRQRLPLAACATADKDEPGVTWKLTAAGLKPGAYDLKSGDSVLATATAKEWEQGVAVPRSPDLDQSEALRQMIVAKNELYFHRWRPQNITYLTGFRAHEQGNNAKEIAEFDPLVAAKEAEIVKLRVPAQRTFELVPAAKPASKKVGK